jgi:Mce-associated membrane protein
MADQADEPTAAAIADPADEPQETAGLAPVASPARRRRFPAPAAGALALLVGATLFAGWRDVRARHDDEARAQMVAAGRAVVLALTTIDHTQIDRDVQRILDASTGAFRDDFAQRAETFKAAARKAESTSVGTVREAGLESVDGDSARVLVALTVMTSNRGAPEQQPKSWRTRVTVNRVDDDFKVAAVEFVP